MNSTASWRGLVWILLLLPWSACGSTELQVSKAPEEPLSSFFEAEVLPIGVELQGKPDAETIEEGQRIAELIAARLTHRLAKSKMFEHSGRKLIVKGRMVEFDPGSRWLRYFVSFGAGTATLRLEVILLDERGSLVAKAMVSSEIWGGAFGGSTNGFGKRVADTIFAFIRNNYKGEPRRPEPTPPTE